MEFKIVQVDRRIPIQTWFYLKHESEIDLKIDIFN